MSENATTVDAIRPKLQAIVEEIEDRFERTDGARDLSLSLQRKIIKHCSLSIRALHRREFEEAENLMVKARELLSRAEEAVRDFPEIYYSGFLQDAQKEYAEARITQSLISGSPLPSPKEIAVDFAPYLNGLGEAVGEMRRYTLDRIRAGDLEESERILEIMDEIYCSLIGVDYPDAITRGLRRSTDLARGCLERTRGDLTNHFDRKRVEKALQYIEERSK
ncbi:MAG TPA: haloacid dehalogenase [Phycisphaerales bacterium]|nr:haloacid dehalogenase [Phycisphaerales bacterium]